MTAEEISAMAEEFGLDETVAGVMPIGHGINLDMTWSPRLNPTQERAYRSEANYILCYGERGTGKSVGALHKIVQHCVNNKNAFALIIVREVGQATEGGAWHKLQTEVLPQWQNGNFDRRIGQRVDAGCGLQWTPSKLDPQDKKPYVWVSNKHGGWSQIKLISLYVGEHVGDKIRGKEPSCVLFDEAQTTEDETYFSDIVQQIGRRQEIETQQWIIYCCNPKGPSHWLYQRFFVFGYDADNEPIEYPIDAETGHPVGPDGPVLPYAVFHVPIAENAHNLPAGYWANVLEAVKHDVVEHQRMVQGLWVDKPDGDAIFGEHWSDADHVGGDLGKQRGLIPAAGYPLVVSWDPGAAHTSVHFLQCIPTLDKLVWAVIDEKNCVGQYMPYRRLVPEVIRRMQYWEEAAGRGADKPVQFRYIHVSDDSAFNQYRAKEGSFDAQDIEAISREVVEQMKAEEKDATKKAALDRFIIKMRAAPKGQHSVEARVRITTDLLAEFSIVVSAICVHTRAMFLYLEQERGERMKPRRSKFLHPFDSLSYAFIYFNSGSGRYVVKEQVEPPEKKEFFRVGSH